MDPKRAKTARGRRALQKMAPKVDENPHSTLVLRGQKTSAVVNGVLTDLFMLKKPLAKHFTRHNAVHPFEDAAPLEFLCQKNDASLFAFGTHSKKRPHNLVLGRMFDHHVLDMAELGIEHFKSVFEFAAVGAGGGSSSESKPCIVFQGAEWEHNPTLTELRSLLTSFFHLRVVDAISPLGIEHFLCFTAVGGEKILMRHYLARLLKSAEGTAPRVELTEMGPSIDLLLRRTQWAHPDVKRAAMVRPPASAAAPKKVKNITRSKLLGKQGRLHVPRQDLGKMATARMKGLRKGKRVGGSDGDAGASKPKKQRTS
jgi:ribosome production factor 2